MNKLLKSLTFFALGALLVAAAGCGSSNTEKKTEKSEKVIKAGATFQSYPDSFIENGKNTGYDVELLELVAKNLEYKVEWTKTDFAGLIGQLDSGKIDTVANNVSITPARKEKYLFSAPFLYEGTQLATHKDFANIKEPKDLFGKNVSAVAGSNHIKVTKEAYPQITVRPYENRDSAMNDLKNKRVEGYVNSRNVLIATIKKANLPFVLVGDYYTIRPSAYPFLKNDKNKKLVKEINSEIEKLRKDGTIKKLSLKYYGIDVSLDPKK